MFDVIRLNRNLISTELSSKVSSNASHETIEGVG